MNVPQGRQHLFSSLFLFRASQGRPREVAPGERLELRGRTGRNADPPAPGTTWAIRPENVEPAGVTVCTFISYVTSGRLRIVAAERVPQSSLQPRKTHTHTRLRYLDLVLPV